MIDLHTHILPGVDDGAGTMLQALELLRQAAYSGTTGIVLTPHCAPAYGFFLFDGEFLEERFQRLSQAARREKIPLSLYPGMEVLYEGQEEFALHIGDYITLCGSRYLLMEFPFEASAEKILEGIDVAGQYGYVPVIAHPERYECVIGDVELVLEGRRHGALFQLNKGSLSGRHGPQAGAAAHALLQLDAVDFVASDAHHPQYRNSRMDRAFHYIQSEYGRQRAHRLFVSNPQKVLQNQPMEYEQPRGTQ